MKSDNSKCFCYLKLEKEEVMMSEDAEIRKDILFGYIRDYVNCTNSSRTTLDISIVALSAWFMTNIMWGMQGNKFWLIPLIGFIISLISVLLSFLASQKVSQREARAVLQALLSQSSYNIKPTSVDTMLSKLNVISLSAFILAILVSIVLIAIYA